MDAWDSLEYTKENGYENTYTEDQFLCSICKETSEYDDFLIDIDMDKLGRNGVVYIGKCRHCTNKTVCYK